jgi:hypothetical protein
VAIAAGVAIVAVVSIFVLVGLPLWLRLRRCRHASVEPLEHGRVDVFFEPEGSGAAIMNPHGTPHQKYAPESSTSPSASSHPFTSGGATHAPASDIAVAGSSISSEKQHGQQYPELQSMTMTPNNAVSLSSPETHRNLDQETHYRHAQNRNLFNFIGIYTQSSAVPQLL